MNIEIIQSLYCTAKIKWSAHCLERMQEYHNRILSKHYKIYGRSKDKEEEIDVYVL
jgi:hypothetical protein